MRLRTELLLYTALLAMLNVLLAFGAIGLFMRMGPAIERIIKENVVSITAAEDVLAEFAAAPGELDAAARQRVHAAIEHAAANVTVAAETPVIGAMRQQWAAAASGAAGPRAELISQTRALIGINRRAMTAVDEEAQRLGTAGAWAAVFIGSLTFAFSLLIVAQLRQRLVDPLLELHAVLAAAREGDRFRRCRMHEAPVELKQAAQALNTLLDERLKP